MADTDRDEAAVRYEVVKGRGGQWLAEVDGYDLVPVGRIADLLRDAAAVRREAELRARIEAALVALTSDMPGEIYVLPPEHHACEREIVALVAKAIRAALFPAEEAKER